MPGQLKPDATCPECGEPLDALVDETSARRVIRTYYHGKNPAYPKRRRPRPCKTDFGSLYVAQLERRALEVEH